MGEDSVQSRQDVMCGYEWSGTGGIVNNDPFLTHRCIEKGAHASHRCHCRKQSPNEDTPEES